MLRATWILGESSDLSFFQENLGEEGPMRGCTRPQHHGPSIPPPLFLPCHSQSEHPEVQDQEPSHGPRILLVSSLDTMLESN